MNTGHLSGEEAVRLIESAKLRGINRILVPSAHYEPEIVKEISNQNCYAEFSFFCISKATEVGLTHIDEEKHKAQPVKIEKMKDNDSEEIIVKTNKAEGNKCPVCWKINVNPCERHFSN